MESPWSFASILKQFLLTSTYFGYCWLRKKVLTKKPTKNWNLQGSKLRGLNIHPSLWTLKWPAKFNLTIGVYAARLLTDNLDNVDSAESDFIFAELHSLVYDSNNYQNQIFRCQVEIQVTDLWARSCNKTYWIVFNDIDDFK